MRAGAKLLPSKLHVRHVLAGLRKSSFFRNVLVVMSGTAAAQCIGFALTPIISRLFSPSDFGVFGSFSSVSTIVAAASTLEYTQAIMLPKEKADAVNLFVVSCLCILTIGVLLLTISLLAPSSLNGLMKTDGFWALSLLILATLAAGLNRSCQAWCVRTKAFKHTSASQVIRSVSSNGGQIGFGYLQGGAPALVLSSVLADLLATLNMIWVVFSDLSAFWCHVSWKRLKKLAWEYRDFPTYSATQNVMNALSSGLPVLLLTHYYGIAVAGAYAFGVRILQVPMGMVVGALRQVMFQKAAETQHKGCNLGPLFVKTATGLFALSLFPSLVLLFWAPQLFTWVFGNQWHLAGEYARCLVLWLMFAFCNLPAVLFARLIRIQRTVFYYDMTLLAVRALTLVLGGLYLTALQTIMLFSFVGAIMNLSLLFIVGSRLISLEGHTNCR